MADKADKVPGCTFTYKCVAHPFKPGSQLVFVRGAFADGAYGPLHPAFTERLKAFRPGGGAYFAFSGHWATGYVAEAQGEALGMTTLWLDQAKAALEAQIPQVGKPVTQKAEGGKAPVIPDLVFA
jgi:hypothetical protein